MAGTYAEAKPGIHHVTPERSRYLQNKMWEDSVHAGSRGFHEADDVFMAQLKGLCVVVDYGRGSIGMPRKVAEMRLNALTRAAFGAVADEVTEIPDELRKLFGEYASRGKTVSRINLSNDDPTQLKSPYKRIDIELPDGTKRIALVQVHTNGQLYGNTFRQDEPNGPWVVNGGNGDMFLGEFVTMFARVG